MANILHPIAFIKELWNTYKRGRDGFLEDDLLVMDEFVNDILLKATKKILKDDTDWFSENGYNTPWLKSKLDKRRKLMIMLKGFKAAKRLANDDYESIEERLELESAKERGYSIFAKTIARFNTVG